MVATDTVCHGGGEQALNGAEHGNDHGCREETLHVFPADVGHGQCGNAGFDFAELVVDGVHMEFRVSVQEIDGNSHHDDGNERAGNPLGNLRCKDDNQDTEHADCRGCPVDADKVL